MALIVQKYGGTSVANLECIAKVAQKIIESRAENHDVVVVLSAMSGQTDYLVGLAKSIISEPDPREYSMLVSTGEQVTIALLALELIKQGYKAKSFTGSQVRILTEGIYHQARIKKIETEKIFKELNEGTIVIIAGFQGVDKEGNITTIGRGGSDTTAVALAAALNAAECQIYTDVEGVYTADPRIVPEARLVDEISFAEMIELASLGAKVLQHRSVEFAGKYRVPLRVLSTFQDGPGTLIKLNEESMEQATVSGITYNRNEVKFTLEDLPEDEKILHRIFNLLSEEDINIDMLMSNDSSTLSFIVSQENYQRTLSLLDNLLNGSACKILTDTHIGKLSVVGIGIGTHPHITSKIFQTLAALNIKIQNIATSEIKVSILIHSQHLEQGVKALHEAFALQQNMHKY